VNPLDPAGFRIEIPAGIGSEELQRRLMALQGRGEVVLDLHRVPHLDATGVAAILLLRRALVEKGGQLRILGCPEGLAGALQLLHLERLTVPARGPLAPRASMPSAPEAGAG
jgi:ABC-type transporter Mla MlaB component